MEHPNHVSAPDGAGFYFQHHAACAFTFSFSDISAFRRFRLQSIIDRGRETQKMPEVQISGKMKKVRIFSKVQNFHENTNFSEFWRWSV